MKKSLPDFANITTKADIKEASRLLKENGGRILVADPHYWGSPADRLTGEFEIHLFDHPMINIRTQYLWTSRGSKMRNGQSWQTGWENDRQYRLYPRRQPTGDATRDLVASWFQNLTIGKEYVFEIAFQSISAMGTEGAENGRHLMLYIPQSVSVENALTCAINWMTHLWHEQAIRTKRKNFPFQPRPHQANGRLRS